MLTERNDTKSDSELAGFSRAGVVLTKSKGNLFWAVVAIATTVHRGHRLD